MDEEGVAIPLSNGGFALVSVEDYPYLSQWKWKRHTQGYASRTTYRDGVFPAVLMHRELVEIPDGFEVDHINRDKLDNRRPNLRVIPAWLNKHNTDTRKTNTSGHTGVSYVAQRGCWRAYIKVQGSVWQRRFSTKEAACAAYAAKRSELLDTVFASLPITIFRNLQPTPLPDPILTERDGTVCAFLPLSNGSPAIVDLDRYHPLMQWSWYVGGEGHVARGTRSEKGSHTIQLSRYLTDAPKGMWVRHINGDLLDNRLANLRVVTPATVVHHRRPSGAIPYKGVHLPSGRKRYKAHIRIDGKTRVLGSFATAEDAARAYNQAAYAAWGDQAWLNPV